MSRYTELAKKAQIKKVHSDDVEAGHLKKCEICGSSLKVFVFVDGQVMGRDCAATYLGIPTYGQTEFWNEVEAAQSRRNKIEQDWREKAEREANLAFQGGVSFLGGPVSLDTDKLGKLMGEPGIANLVNMAIERPCGIWTTSETDLANYDALVQVGAFEWANIGNGNRSYRATKALWEKYN